MNAHKLALLLLEGPDLPVIIQDDHYACLVEVLRIKPPRIVEWQNWDLENTGCRDEAIELEAS